MERDHYKESNKKALNILGKGVDSLGFIIKNPDAITCSNIENLLEGISYEKTEINFVSEGKGRETVEIILKLLEEKNINPFLFRGAFEADPLGRLMINGKLCTTVEKGYDYLAELFRLASPLKSFRLVQVNASHFSNAGADIVTELAYSISKGIHRAFTQTHSMKHWHCRQISQQE
ncbi:MAG: methylmalonyl-CoA mutase family protein [Bacteroidales bacterium]